jgi:hypothetical protein
VKIPHGPATVSSERPAHQATVRRDGKASRLSYDLRVRRPASGELSAMLPVKADRAEGNLIPQVVSSGFFLFTFAPRRARFFELRPGLLGDVDTDSRRR